jgi:hypothetical protein
MYALVRNKTKSNYMAPDFLEYMTTKGRNCSAVDVIPFTDVGKLIAARFLISVGMNTETSATDRDFVCYCKQSTEHKKIYVLYAGARHTNAT